MIIYKITNIINRKVYIGQTIQTLELRFKQHCRLKNKRSCRLLLNAIKKYGAQNFIIEKLCNCASKSELNKQEAFFIKEYNSFGKGYNLTSGGDRVELSEASKALISKSLTGKPSPLKGTKARFPVWNKGKPWSAEMKIKLSNAHKGQSCWTKGKALTDEHKNSISKAQIGKSRPDKYKSIICLNNNIIYSSGRHAATALNLRPSHICSVLKGTRSHTGGYKFEYFKPQTGVDSFTLTIG